MDRFDFFGGNCHKEESAVDSNGSSSPDHPVWWNRPEWTLVLVLVGAIVYALVLFAAWHCLWPRYRFAMARRIATTAV